jgi:hypothetical protein
VNRPTYGDTWLAGEAGPPVVLHHRNCGHDMQAEVVGSHCREPLALRDVPGRSRPDRPRTDRPRTKPP